MKMKLLNIVALAAFVAVVAKAQDDDEGDTFLVITRPCANTPGKGVMNAINARPCSSNPCAFKKGSNITFEFDFTSDQNSATARIEATVSVNGMDFTVPGLISDLCNGPNNSMGLLCPLVANKSTIGGFQMTIPSVPVTTTTVTCKIYGVKGLSTCFQFDIRFEK